MRAPRTRSAGAATRPMVAVAALTLLGGACSAEAGPDALDANPPRPPPAAPESPETIETPKPSPSDDRLLPDLQSLPPEDVHIVATDDGRQLRFTSVIANTGIGPVETAPAGHEPCPADQREALQVIYHDVDGDGSYDRDTDTETSTRIAGCMIDHPEHDHWHFEDAARYLLAAPGDPPQLIVEVEKVSFCWVDSREAPSGPDPQPADHYHECDYDDVQGVTPGWADVYAEDLDGQHFVLPDDLADGVYCLWNQADPLGLLLELDDQNNAGVTAIQISGTDAAEAPAEDCADSFVPMTP